METEEVEDFEYNKPPVCIFCDSKSTEDVFEPESIPESATYNKQITTDTTPCTTPTTTRHNKDITGSPASSSIPDMQTIEGLLMAKHTLIDLSKVLKNITEKKEFKNSLNFNSAFQDFREVL